MRVGRSTGRKIVTWKIQAEQEWAAVLAVKVL